MGSKVPIVIVPYPQPVADTVSCGSLAMSFKEREFVRNFLDDLDQQIANAAFQAHFYYLTEMHDAMIRPNENLQLCGTGKDRAGINFVDLQPVNGLAGQRFNPGHWLHNSLHPNERGHRAMAAVLNQWVTGNPNLTPDSPATAAVTVTQRTKSAVKLARSAAPPVTAPTRVAPPCTLDGSSAHNCQTQSRDWDRYASHRPVAVRAPDARRARRHLAGRRIASLTLAMTGGGQRPQRPLISAKVRCHVLSDWFGSSTEHHGGRQVAAP